MTALARYLQMRGHEVVFLYSSGAAGLPFIPDEEVERVISERSAEISKKQGEETLKLTTSLLMSQSESMIKSLPAIVQSNQIDALIINYLIYYVELAAIQLDIPYIHVYAGMHFDFSGHTPLMFYGWPHETNAAALASITMLSSWAPGRNAASAAGICREARRPGRQRCAFP